MGARGLCSIEHTRARGAASSRPASAMSMTSGSGPLAVIFASDPQEFRGPLGIRLVAQALQQLGHRYLRDPTPIPLRNDPAARRPPRQRLRSSRLVSMHRLGHSREESTTACHLRNRFGRSPLHRPDGDVVTVIVKAWLVNRADAGGFAVPVLYLHRDLLSFLAD
jgi:hypothetical protein